MALANVADDHRFRSRRQHPAITCNLSVVGPHRGIRVRGCPWSSVAVDVPIDVGQGSRRSRAPTGCIYGRRAPDAGSGVSPPGSSSGGVTDDLHAGAVWHIVDLAPARPHGIPRAALKKADRASSSSARGMPCGSPWGGRGEATPCLTRPSRSIIRGRPSQRPARPARAASLSPASWRPSE